MSLILISREDLENQSLAHYRTPGSKNGQRLYQYEDGSLTPLGRIHYGVGQAKKAISDEVKGVTKKVTAKYTSDKKSTKTEAKKEINESRSEREKAKADEHLRKAAEFDKKVEKYKEKQEHLKEKEEKREKTDAEIKKDVEDKIKAFNEKTHEAKKERDEKAAEEKKERQAEIAEIRSLSDMELNKRIERLQKERTLSDLINDRANYEKNPLQAKAAKIFEQFAENFARKALNQAGDVVLQKLMDKAKNGNLDLSKNKNQISQNNKDNSKPKDNSNNNNNSGNYNASNRFGKQEKQKIRSMASAGKSIAEIAKSMNTTEDRVKGFMASAGITIDKDKKDS